MQEAPTSLLRDVHWSFAEPVPGSPVEFLEAARAYAFDVDAPDPGELLSQRLPFYDVRILYDHAVQTAEGDWRKEVSEVRVVGLPPARLTGAELLWELHVACAANVGGTDSHYFEGLELESTTTGQRPLAYRVVLGS